MAIKTFKKGDTTRLSKNFLAYEFDCKCKNSSCRVTKIDEKLVGIEQQVRDHFGKPVTHNSSYRCATHNKKVGGSASSYHKKGKASDIVVEDTAPIEVAKFCESIGVKGIGLYDTFVHIDTRTKKFFWYGHKQEKRTTFGGASPVVEKKATEPARASDKTLAGTYRVTAYALNVRNGAGATKKIMVTIPKGTLVKCYGYYTEVRGVKWLAVQFTYKSVVYTGFASTKYLVK